MKLSKKASLLEASQTLALTALALKMKSDGVDVVSLTAGEPNFPTPAHIKLAAVKAIDDDFTKYTANAGIPGLRASIVEKFRNENNLHFDASQILVSNGAKHSIYNALQAICNPGDEVIFSSPYWVSYPEMVKLVDAKSVVINTNEKTLFKITPSQLRKAITKKTKALILCSPSNPTGSVYSKHEFEELAHVIEKSGIFVISDEIYEKVIYDDHTHFSIGSIPAIKEQVITVNGVSKAYAMTGWRIGYFGANHEITAAAEKIQSQMTSNASSISQRAALAAISGSDHDAKYMTSEFKKRRDYIYDAVCSIKGMSCVKPAGAFYLFPNVSKYFGKKYNGETLRSSDAISHFLLKEENLVVVPGSGFGADNFIRLSYACSMEELEKAAERMHRGFAKLL
ncbi:MAG TPA: aspartate aminotransferase [Bacteroidetes bacterium]|nr:aspartate aminotransferase [Bacteroidota bacterium]